MKKVLLMIVACLMLVIGGCRRPDATIVDRDTGQTTDVYVNHEPPEKHSLGKTLAVGAGLLLLYLVTGGGSSGN